jgi:hypothetical protein
VAEDLYLYRAELTASFLERLDAIEVFLTEADEAFAFDDLGHGREQDRLPAVHPPPPPTLFRLCAPLAWHRNALINMNAVKLSSMAQPFRQVQIPACGHPCQRNSGTSSETGESCWFARRRMAGLPR